MDASQYEKDFKNLREKANNGTLTKNDHVYKTLEQKRNVRAVDIFMTEMETKLK